MKTIEGNKLIAEFMGWKHLPADKFVKFARFEIGEEGEQMSNPKYHSSWDWLMPVVEKIETDASQETGHNEIHITENTCVIFRMSYIKPEFKNIDSKSKITAVWKTVVQYTQWYNDITNQ